MSAAKLSVVIRTLVTAIDDLESNALFLLIRCDPSISPSSG